MSYNIRNGVGIDNIRNHQRTADVIKSQSPDVVAIQEVDSITNRSNHTDVLAEIAELTGMQHTFAPAIDYDGGKYGIGILSKEKPVSIRRIPLPGREEKRTLVIAEFNDFYFASTHLSLTEEDCLSSVDIIKGIAAENNNKPFILAGDFNAAPHGEIIKKFAETFTILNDTSLKTFPADNPDQTIDYIMLQPADADIALISTSVPEAPTASDHRPLTATLSL